MFLWYSKTVLNSPVTLKVVTKCGVTTEYIGISDKQQQNYLLKFSAAE